MPHPLLRGLRASLPVVLGYLPIAVSFGIVAAEAGMPAWWAPLMSLLVYAGASQFAAVAMIKLATPLPEIVLATLFMNLRHLVMSLSMAPRLRLEARGARMLAGAGLTDESFAVASLHPDDALRTGWGLVGVMLPPYLAWVAGTVLGSELAPLLPAAVGQVLGIAIYGLFIGLLVPALKGARRGLVPAGVAMATNWALSGLLAPGWALVAAILAGSLAALLPSRGEAA